MFRVVMPSSAVLLTVSIAAGAATLVAVPLLAQTLLVQNDPPKAGEAGKPDPGNKPDPAKPDPANKPDPGKADPAKADQGKADPGKADAGKADPGKADAGKSDPGKADAAKSDAGKSDTVKDAGGRPDESSAEAARIRLGPAGRGECVWIGTRILSLLWKDDLDTAFRHLDLYDRFGCPGEHLQLSFRCVTHQGDDIPRQGGGIQKKEPPKDPTVFAERVDACWLNPAMPAAPANQPTAAVEKPGTK